MPLNLSNRLSFRLALVVVLGAFLVGFILSCTQVVYDFIGQKKEHQALIERILDVSAPTAAQAARRLDETVALEVTNGLFVYSFIVDARITDEQGNILAARQNPNRDSGQTRWITRLLMKEFESHSLDLRNPGNPQEKFGELTIIEDRDQAFSGFYRRAGTVFLSGIVQSFILGGLLFGVFYFLVSQPLFRLVENISRIDPHQPGKSRLSIPSSHKNDELGLLANAANEFLDASEQYLIERGQADEALRSSEERFRDIAESSSDWFWEMGTDLRYTYMSERAFELFELSPDDVLGKTREELSILRKWVIGAEKVSELHELEKKHQPFHGIRYAIRLKDGSIRYLEFSGKPTFDQNGTFVGYRGSGSNISERIRADEAHQLLSQTIDSVDIAIALFDSQDRLVFSNNRYRQQMEVISDILVPGVTFEEMLRTIVARRPVQTAVGREEAYIRERLDHHRNPTGPFILQRDDRWVQAEEVPIPDGGIFVILTDITDRKQAEDDVIARNRQLTALNRISEILLAHRPLKDIYQDIVREISALSDYPIVSIASFNAEKNEMKFEASVGIIDNKNGTLTVPIDEAMAGVVFKTGEPLIETNAQSRHEYKNKRLRALGIQTLVCVPMSVEGHVTGAISFAHTDQVVVDDAFVQWALSLSNHVALSTERILADEALRESEEQFRDLVESTNVVAWEMRLDTWRFSYVSPHAEKLFGYPIDDWYAKNFWADHIHPDDRERAVAFGVDKTKRGEDHQFEYRMMTADGRVVWVHNIATVESGPDGPNTMHGFLIDITSRKLMEEAMRNSEERFRVIAETSPVAIFISEINEGEILYCNTAAGELLDMPVVEIMRSSVTDFYQQAESRQRLVSRLRKGETVRNVEVGFRRQNGESVSVLISLQQLQFKEETAVLSAVMDITDLKNAQAQLVHSSKLLMLGEMATGIAHELNQPLTAINNYAQGSLRRLRSGRANVDEVMGAIEQVSGQAQRAGEIIRQIRNLARKEEPKKVQTDINATVREAAGLLDSLAVRKQVDVRLKLGKRLPVVLGDAIQIQQVVLNLAWNGMEAMEEGKNDNHQLIIGTSRKDNDFIEVTVQDNGPGLPESIRSRLFEPFFTTKNDGMGIGLSICRSIIEAHGGQLFVDDKKREGAAFHFTLPIGS